MFEIFFLAFGLISCFGFQPPSLFNETCIDSETGLHCLHDCDKVLIDCLDECFSAECQVEVHSKIREKVKNGLVP